MSSQLASCGRQSNDGAYRGSGRVRCLYGCTGGGVVVTGDELYQHADELALEAVVGEHPELPRMCRLAPLDPHECHRGPCWGLCGHEGGCEPG